MQNYRIAIPRTADELLQLADLIVTKSEAEGNNSSLQCIPMDDFADLLKATKANKIERDRIRRDAHTLTEEYSQSIGTSPGQTVGTPNTILHFVTMARDVLLGINKGKERKLGDYGFEVLGGSHKTEDGGEIGIDEDGVDAS